MKKSMIVCGCLLLVALFFSGCANSLYQQDLKASRAIGTKAVSASQETTVEQEEKTETVPEKLTYSKQEVNQLTTEFKAKWQEAEKGLSQLQKSTDSDGVERFAEGNDLRKIQIGKDVYGITDLHYVREYFFDNDGMYFARLTDGNREMRFYFKGGTLIRWIDEANNAYDATVDHKDFAEYEKVLFLEAKDLWTAFMDEQISAGF